MSPRLLALDTSTDLLAIALLTPGFEACVNEAGGPQASARLVPRMLQMLTEGGVAWSQLQAIAFGQGPGAFTGLRTACAVAQGLAFAHGLPVLPIDSLLIVAEDARRCAPGDPAAVQDWWVAMDARMDEVYAAHYRFDVGHWQVLQPPGLWAWPALAEHWAGAPPQRVAGSAISAFADRLPWGAAQCWPQVSDRAAALGHLARSAWARGVRVAAPDALPLYLRDKVALTTAERLLARTT
jgi:tRNA threonylcarbamoyladenosine biosynthesis protein TsaB